MFSRRHTRMINDSMDFSWRQGRRHIFQLGGGEGELLKILLAWRGWEGGMGDVPHQYLELLENAVFNYMHDLMQYFSSRKGNWRQWHVSSSTHDDPILENTRQRSRGVIHPVWEFPPPPAPTSRPAFELPIGVANRKLSNSNDSRDGMKTLIIGSRLQKSWYRASPPGLGLYWVYAKQIKHSLHKAFWYMIPLFFFFFFT